jgi:hypothetical protein
LGILDVTICIFLVYVPVFTTLTTTDYFRGGKFGAGQKTTPTPVKTYFSKNKAIFFESEEKISKYQDCQRQQI